MNKRIASAVCGLILFGASMLAADAKPKGTPAVGAPKDLLLGQTWNLARPDSESAELSEVNDSADLPAHLPSEKVIAVNRAVDPYYGIQLTTGPIPLPSAGDRIRFRFWAKASGGNPMRAVVETAGAPWTSLTQESITLTSHWTYYTIEGTVSQTFDQLISARLQFGGKTGKIEFAGITLEDLGQDPAIAEAKAAITPAATAARIAKYRMGMLTVIVRDARGKAVPGVTVHVAMKRHAFLFGSNFFGLNPADSSPSAVAYRDRFTVLLNYGTLPFYWGAFEGQQGKPDFPRLNAMADWCNAHGIVPKAHPLVWHEVYPSWAPKDPEAAIPALRNRVTEIVTREKERIRYYDIVNEAANGASYSPANGESLWIKRDGAPKVVETALKWARAVASPSDRFIYNDYETGQPNVALITQMQKDGILPDAIGIQSHMHGGTWPLERVWQICQTYGKFGLPIHFTEVTVLSGPKRDADPRAAPSADWDSTPEGEAAQADYVAKFYTLLFSHPALRAITWWDFSDANSWMGAPSGLIRKDMTPKPAYDRLMRLIRHDWWTDATGVTDKKGSFKLRAFHGNYEVTVDDGHGRHATQAFSFPEDNGPLAVSVGLK